MTGEERRLYPHVLVLDRMTDMWRCACGRTLTSEWLYRVLGWSR